VEGAAEDAAADSDADADSVGDAEPVEVSSATGADAARLPADAEELALALALAGDEAGVGLSEDGWPPWPQAVRLRVRAAARPATARSG
jgi:hypothetical protein